MGLDMSLMRCKRLDNATVDEALKADDYLDWLERPNEYTDSSCKEWNGLDDSDLTPRIMALAKLYKKERKERGESIHWKSISEEIGYWRKANAIHKWFVDVVQYGEDDCGCYEVSRGDLEQLLDLCTTIVNSAVMIRSKVTNGYSYANGEFVANEEDGWILSEETKELAEQLLPTQSGFFFGSTDYDQWYMEDLKNTIEIINNVLETVNWDNDIVYYHASW